MESQDRPTSTSEFETKVTFATVGFVVGTIAGALAAAMFFWRKGKPAAERPPIIVKGGSLIIENDLDYGYVEWVADGSDWTPAQGNGDPVVQLYATLDRGTSTGSPLPIQADKLEITYRRGTNEKKFKIWADQRKPKVGKETDLDVNPKGRHQLIYDLNAGGEVVEIKGGNKRCTLSNGAQVRIRFV